MNPTSQREYMMRIEALEQRLAAMTQEIEEQARLLGIRGSKEARLIAELAAMTADRKALQSLIDTLMLEHCPEEMTEAQKENWARHQRPVSEELQTAIDSAIHADIEVTTPDRDYSQMSPKDCYELGMMDGVMATREQVAAKLNSELDAMTKERDKCIKECNEFWGKRSDQDFELICALQAREQQLREVLRNLSFMAMTSGGTGGRDDGLVSSIEKANDALALTQDDTVLRKWGAKLLHDMARKKLLWTASEIHCKAYELRSGKCAT